MTDYATFVEEALTRHIGLAVLLCGDRHRAEDLLQDCLVKLYLRWRQVTKKGDPHAYLRRMLVNGNISRWRSGRREALTGETPDRVDPLAEVREPHDQLRAALMALPQQQRAVVVLRYYVDLSEQQVAAELGCSVGTVKTQHSRAMAKLRDRVPGLHSSIVEVGR
ncbi:SigE family RNA polymerase sigma factor [Hamadaea sp. NPDC051192]|uniref:SigE family RNA polymerase sigma factor n=1 Tax=Hamadaea sp. NPDC051192 TaxID=3154940 RepID=UPI0034468EDF